MKVRNVKPGQYQVPEGYTDWKDFWVSNSSESFGACGFFACMYEATVVLPVVGDDGSVYVLPLCYSCSKFPIMQYVVANEKLLVLLKDASSDD